MIDFAVYFSEIEKILVYAHPGLAESFRYQLLTKEPREVYSWCSENLKSINNHRLHEILVDFYYSVR
jgi:hypothetical protein